MGLCSLVTSLDPETFSKHIGDQDAIADLILKIIQVNEAYFKEEKPKNRKNGKEKIKKTLGLIRFSILFQMVIGKMIF